MEKRTLTRESYLARAVVKPVDLPDGSVVHIRALPAAMLIDSNKSTDEVFGTANMLVHSLCEADGELMFAEGEQGDAMSVDYASLQAILAAILALNGLTPVKQGETDIVEGN